MIYLYRRSLTPLLFILLLALSQTLVAQEASVQRSGGSRGSRPIKYHHPLIRFQFSSGQLLSEANAALAVAQARVAAIKKIPTRKQNFRNTVLALENMSAEFGYRYQRLSFMGDVHLDESIRDEALKADSLMSAFFSSVFSDVELYQILKTQKPRTSAEKTLFKETLQGFVSSGAILPDDQRAEFVRLSDELSDLQLEFGKNLRKASTAVFTGEELKGVPQSVLERLEKDANGGYVVSTDPDVYTPVMEYAEKGEARRKLFVLYNSRAAKENTEILSKEVHLRKRLAEMLGYKSWAEMTTKNRMAGSEETVNKFLADLRDKLASANQKELGELLALKKAVEPGATEVTAWDRMYLTRLYQEKNFQVDGEKIKEYFPIEQVQEGLFKIYSKLLGVRFEKVTDVPVWDDGVNLYRVIDGKSGKLLSHFYTDLYPRDGKYKHFAAFPLIMGRKTKKGYVKSLSALVCNYPRRTSTTRSLLSLDQVETFLHEFGHIMHGVLTEAEFASLAGTSTVRDFVEAPSQMLEHWAHDYEMIKLLSGHKDDPSQKLPRELFEKSEVAGRFGRGIQWTRQLVLASFDMALHGSNPPGDVNEVYDRLTESIAHIARVPDTAFGATFGHIGGGGYSAVYYGYLWSKDLGDDMASLFTEGGMLNEELGARYRANILARGGMEDALVLVERFLQRKTSHQAFFKELGIEGASSEGGEPTSVPPQSLGRGAAAAAANCRQVMASF